jgi:hypothetical protein
MPVGPCSSVSAFLASQEGWHVERRPEIEVGRRIAG